MPQSIEDAPALKTNRPASWILISAAGGGVFAELWEILERYSCSDFPSGDAPKVKYGKDT